MITLCPRALLTIPYPEGKDPKKEKSSIGLDSGIKTTITIFEGGKYDIIVREPEYVLVIERFRPSKKMYSRYRVINEGILRNDQGKRTEAAFKHQLRLSGSLANHPSIASRTPPAIALALSEMVV